MSEVPWEKVLVCELAAPEIPKARKCRCGNKNCQTAKRIRCVCGCHAENHGVENRRSMSPLDDALGLTKEAPVPLGDLGLNLELSGRLGQ